MGNEAQEAARRILARDLSYHDAEVLITKAVANGVVKGGLRLMLLAFLLGLLVGVFRAVTS